MRRALAVLLPLAIVLALAVWRAEGPAPRDASTPANEFSSARASETLHTLLANEGAHPLGTAANARVRDRVVARFTALGYDTRVLNQFACNAGGVCGQVQNVLARPRGASGDTVLDTVLVTAHYDSVGSGPGASDDGVGTAALLEVARAIRGERFRNPVAFLITDGEEAGLLGAEGFVADETLSGDVSAVVNVEMRGTYGLSNMFETSTGNRWLIRHLARALERPQATSFFYAIYNLLPNDTDVTIFKRAGKASVNFAAIRGVNWYHTPYDDLAHVNPPTLQHHGDNILATVRALASADLAARSKTDATYFDVLNFKMIWWPQEWTLWLAIVSLILLIFAARRQPPREMTFGVLTAFIAIVFAAVGGMVLATVAQLRAQGISFVARPTASVAAMWLLGIAAALFAAALFRKRAQPLPLLYGVTIVWHTIGIALALTLPGAAFVFIVPAVAVTICALARASDIATSAIAATVAAILIFPMGLMLYDALGGPLMYAVALLIGILSTLVAPLFRSIRGAAAVALLAIACAVTAMLLPAYTPDRPRRINLSHVDDRTPRWVIGANALTPELAKAAKFTPYEDKLRGNGYAAPAPRVAPRVAMTSTREGEKLTVNVRSARGANRLTLVLEGDVKILRVKGTAIPPRPARFRERMPKGTHVAVANGVESMTVECTARGTVKATASDLTFGLPGAGAALMKARDASIAIPIHDGDTTVTRLHATLTP